MYKYSAKWKHNFQKVINWKFELDSTELWVIYICRISCLLVMPKQNFHISELFDSMLYIKSTVIHNMAFYLYWDSNYNHKQKY
jgi:hypothetical protein